MPDTLPSRQPLSSLPAMNILILTSEFTPVMGGIGTYACEIAAAASRLGAAVTMVAPDYGRSRAADDARLPFNVIRFPGGLHSMRHLPQKIMLARREVRRNHYHVVHAADWPFFIPEALCRWDTPARVVMTVHGTEINEAQTRLKRLAVRGAGVFGPRTEVVANSHFTENLFRERFAKEAAHTEAILLGVSDFWFGERRTRAEVRAEHHLTRDQIVIVTVARITRRKGHHLTLQALARLPDHLRKRVTWLVIGPDGEAEYVKQLRQLAGSVDCDVRLLGSRSNEEIRDIYGAADLFCLTGLPDSSGRVEGFGLVYLEAGAGQLPSIATAVGGVPDAITDQESGLLVPPDTDSIARAITLLTADYDRRKSLAAGAFAHAQKLSWERCAAATYGLPHAGSRAGRVSATAA